MKCSKEQLQLRIKEAQDILSQTLSKMPVKAFLLIMPSTQEIYLINDDKVQLSYSISTSKYGLGNKNESFQTPVGIHYIAKKIGHDIPRLTIFKGRKPLPGNLTLDDLNSDGQKKLRDEHFQEFDDVITSRILWLKGCEEGINKGGDVDTYNRYIYIHGTAHEDKIGETASHGCIRMKNNDVISLFDAVSENMMVLILDN